MKSCQPFSCPCTLCDALPKRVLFDMYVKESMPLVKSKPPLPPRSLRSLRAAARSTSFIVVASSLQKIELWYPNFGLQAIDCDHATAESQWRIVEDQLLDAFSRRGLEAGLPAFQLPMVGKCDILPKRYVRQTCWRHLFPPFLLNSKHPIRREAWGSWEPQYARRVLHCACIFPIPSLQLQIKEIVSCRDAKRLVTQLRSPRFCRKPVASQWRAASLSAAHVLYVTHCRKEICSTCMSRNPCLLWNLSLHSLPEAWGPWERQRAPPASLWLHHPCKR